ncbi:MAG: PspA-associated protein PspAB [Candidatus Nanopelagicales bacterium]
MGFLDGLLGRRKPSRPNLDALFAIPNAAITLEVSLGFRPTGQGAVAFRATEGRAFADIESEVTALLDADGGPPVRLVTDHFGYTWLVVATDPPDVSAVVTDLHAVNATLSDHGFGPQLLCSIVPFRDPGGRVLALLYLYKRGTFYPFVPMEGERRDSVTELQVRDAVGGDLPWEADLSRWFPVWDAPGL